MNEVHISKIAAELNLMHKKVRAVMSLPYRPKRRTRATIAKEKGLEPLAQCVFAQDDRDPASEAAAFVDAEKGVDSVEDALSGARDIIAEWVSEDQTARTQMMWLKFNRK